MSNKDTVSHDYMANAEHFADAYNYYAFDGEQVLRAEQLKAEDTVEELIVNKFDEIFTTKKSRDVLKTVSVKSDDNMTYAILGIENQSYVDYAMPVRNMVYDALNYASQVSSIKKKDKTSKKLQSGNEYLSGVSKGTKIKPIITLVINFSKDLWDGPTRLSDMLDNVDSRLGRYVNDYELHLIDPHAIDDFTGFHTELGEVLEFIKRQNEDGYLKTMKIEKGENWELDLDSVNMINTFTGARIPTDTAKGGKVNMCRATEAIREDGIKVGMKEGRKEGRKEGVTETNIVYSWLFEQGRDADVKRATTDAEFLERLVDEYNSREK